MTTNIEVRNLVWSITIVGNFIEWEVPTGTINWINLDFALNNTPIPLREKVFLNWMRIKKSFDYTIFTNIITFVNPPVSGDIILVDYNY